MNSRIGLIINPVAGMGGKVGLKGTDGSDAVARARELGAVPVSEDRALLALERLRELLPSDPTVLTAGGAMGEDVVRSVGWTPTVVSTASENSFRPDDTEEAARAIRRRGVDLLLFAGGDGTARNVFEAIGSDLPVLGIPTGVKMHSSVFATTPRAAGDAAADFLLTSDRTCREAEVMDIDEDAFRNGRVSAQLYGYLSVPRGRALLQGLKGGSGAKDESEFSGIASELAERMQDGGIWILGPGTTTRSIATGLGLKKTLLGVDVYSNGSLLLEDGMESEILAVLRGGSARIVVTPIGGQGFIFGRGNQQLTPTVIREVGKANIHLVAAPAKLAGLTGGPLLVDTGDQDLDRLLAGYWRVITGYHQESVHRVA